MKMDLSDKFKKMRLPKAGILAAAMIIIVMAIIIIAGITGSNADRAEPAYAYGSYVESKLADDVIWYLSGVDGIDQTAREEIADYAVQNYQAVISSGTAAVTDEHSEALTGIFKNKLKEYAPDYLTGDELYALSSGISSYVWQAVLSSINEYKAADMEPGYDDEYMELAESLQAQIDELENRRMNIHITARLNNDGTDGSGSGADTGKYLSGAGLDMDEKFNELDDDIDRRLSDITSDLQKELNSSVTDDVDRKLDGIRSDIASKLEKELGDSMTDDVDKKLDRIKSDIASELEKELKNSIQDGKDGTAGRDGQDGENGRDGKDGQDGQDGQDGKSTYVAYADDASGNGFSLTPTETSKYIGTCATTADRQPSNASEYGNWQIYRNYIITSATDENGSTTLYIR